jgi:hypothetical protein
VPSAPLAAVTAFPLESPDTSFHADEARRHIRKPFPNLAARPLLAQDDRTSPIEADDVEAVFAVAMCSLAFELIGTSEFDQRADGTQLRGG